MKAYILEKVNDLQYKEVNMSVVPEGWLLVKVRNVGICGSDIPRIYQTGAHRHPLIPGHEFAGEVVETGQRVGVYPLIPCGECPQCKAKKYEMCANYNYLGSRCDGGFAEYVAVPKWNLLELPDNVTFEDAAMLEPTAVAAHAMRAMNVQSDETVCVLGLGTIGLLLVMLLKELGVRRVLAIGTKILQKEKALELGVAENEYCDAKSVDVEKWLQNQTDGKGVNVFFECVGRQETYVQVVNNTASSGRVMLVGNPYGDMQLPKDVYWKILRRQMTIKGTWNSSYTDEENDDWHYVLERIAAGRISPSKLISHRLTLEDAQRGFEIMRDKTEGYVKVMIEV